MELLNTYTVYLKPIEIKLGKHISSKNVHDRLQEFVSAKYKGLSIHHHITKP